MADLAEFAAQCKLFFNTGSPAAQSYIERTLHSPLDPSQRSAYLRTQALIRSEYHEEQAALRCAKLEAEWDKWRLPPFDTQARKISHKERKRKLRVYLDSQAAINLPGPHPFFKAIWVILRVQSMKVQKGGAGIRRIEFALKDEVFMETGLQNAVELLIGVLGFEQVEREASFFAPRDSAEYDDDDLATLATTEDHSTSLDDDDEDAPFRPVTQPSPNPDPFADPATARQRRKSTLQKRKHTRILLAPSFLTDPELVELATIFPAYLTPKHLRDLKFSSSAAQIQDQDLETGPESSKLAPDCLRMPTGIIRLGIDKREDGYRGGFWARIKMWWTVVVRGKV